MTNIAVFGCGAVGSLLAVNLATPEIRFILIDDDLVGPENINTSAYLLSHINMPKPRALAETLYRKNKTIGVPVISTMNSWDIVERLVTKYEVDIVLDCFDNDDARWLLCKMMIDTLHVGVTASRTGACEWEEIYNLNPDGRARGDNPVCTHDLGRPILQLTAALAAAIVQRFLNDGTKTNRYITESLHILT